MFSSVVNVVLGVSTCLGLLLILYAKVKARRLPVYVRQKALFTEAESAFLAALDRAVAQEFRILGKVRIADLVRPHSALEEREWRKAFYRVSSKHVDFVLCDRETLFPVCAIELDDSSHRELARCERDAFVDSVFKSAALALVRFPAKRHYTNAEIANVVHFAIEHTPNGVISPSPSPLHSS